MAKVNSDSGRVESVRVTGTAGTGVVRLHGRDLEYTATCETGATGPHVVALSLTTDGGRPLTVADLRAVPLRRIAAAVGNVIPLPGSGVTDLDWSTFGEPDRPPKRARPRGRPPKLTDDDHRRVAELARQAVRDGKPVRRFLSQRLDLSPSTVDTRLRKAEEHGYLQPGELPRGVKSYE
ncbi:hypothetical protein ACWDPV_12015 [Gordonia sp. NPDC003504]